MRRAILCAVLCGLICQMSGCYHSYMANVEVLQTVEEQPTVEKSTESAEQTADVSIQTVEASEEAVAAVDTEEQSGEYSIDTFEVAEEIEIQETVEQQTAEAPSEEQTVALNGAQLEEISYNNVFVDYDYIQGYEGTYDPEACGEALGSAVLALKQTEDYKSACMALSSGKPLTGPDTERHEKYENGYVHDFYEVVEGGEYNPIFYMAYIDDFDNDSREEQFILLKFPWCAPGFDKDAEEHTVYCRYYLAFVGADGNAEILDNFWMISDVTLLDYGMDKQLIFTDVGIYGADEHDPLYGVVDGKAERLYGIRGGYEKWECFLYTHGWQGTGDFMYYDTAAKEYRAIVGVLLDKNEVTQMDSTGSIPYPDEYFQVSLVGGKYYLFSMGVMDSGSVYVYEDGRFIPAEGKLIRTAKMHDKAVLIDDIDKAIEGMITPEEAAVYMPKPFYYDDADFNSDFHYMLKSRFQNIDTEIIKMSGPEEFNEWIDEVENSVTCDIEHDINLYAVMKRFSLDTDAVCERLQWLNEFNSKIGYEPAIYTDEELEALKSGDKDQVCGLLASEYSIVIGDMIFSPEWVYYHSAEDYEAFGITPEMLKEKAELYAEMDFADEPRKAFERKLSGYCGVDIEL